MDPRAMTLAERRACERFEVGDLALECGRVLPGAWLAFRTWGRLDAARANAVLYPTCYAGTHWENDWLIGPAAYGAPAAADRAAVGKAHKEEEICFVSETEIVTWVFQEVSMLAVAAAAAAPAPAARAASGVELATDAAVAAPLRAGAAGGAADKVLHLIRHGQTEMNVYLARAPAGFKDPLLYDTRLTAEGQRQARALAALAAQRAPAPELIVTSPLTRALQTMELVFPAAKAPKVVEAAARERLYMASDVGRSPEVVADEYPHLYFDHLPNGRQDPLAVVVEPPDVFDERVSRFRKWLAARPEHTIAVVSHWGVLHQLTGRDFGNCELFTCRLSEIQNVRLPVM
eukprot:SM000216S06579  [mRNA]  locus=s216:174941:180922:- [translate_table: standard]